ncbi:MAG: DUF177 domain-containing protein [Candidatus Coatesbacteria bacterium]
MAFRWEEPAATLGLETEPAFRHAISVEVTARKIGAQVLVNGVASSLIRLECGRCLEAFERTVRADVAIAYREGTPPNRRVDVIGDDEPEASWYEPPFIDPGEDLRQIMLVAMPDYPVCRADCRGLCPQCGANLNLAPCGHKVEGTDGQPGRGVKVPEGEKET